MWILERLIEYGTELVRNKDHKGIEKLMVACISGVFFIAPVFTYCLLFGRGWFPKLHILWIVTFILVSSSILFGTIYLLVSSRWAIIKREKKQAIEEAVIEMNSELTEVEVAVRTLFIHGVIAALYMGWFIVTKWIEVRYRNEIIILVGGIGVVTIRYSLRWLKILYYRLGLHIKSKNII